MSTIYKIQHHREQGNPIPCKINTSLSPAAKQDVKKKEGSGRAPLAKCYKSSGPITIIQSSLGRQPSASETHDSQAKLEKKPPNYVKCA